MECTKKRDLLEIIEKSTEELHQKIDMHRYLIATILDKKISEKRLDHILLPDLKKELRLSNAVKEAIEVLEETRKAFKSKRLEVLRKNLIKVLTEL